YHKGDTCICYIHILFFKFYYSVYPRRSRCSWTSSSACATHHRPQHHKIVNVIVLLVVIVTVKMGVLGLELATTLLKRLTTPHSAVCWTSCFINSKTFLQQTIRVKRSCLCPLQMIL